MSFLAGNKIRAMESELFRHPQRLTLVNFQSNACINAIFSDLKSLSKAVDESCEQTDPAEVKPICEVIEKCSIGEKCCRLSKFKSSSRSDLKYLKHGRIDEEVDAVSYNSNPSVEYLLVSFEETFKNLKVYDASNCAVREIFWENFNWNSLKSINLANNQITSLVGELRLPLKNLDLCNYTLFSF